MIEQHILDALVGEAVQEIAPSFLGRAMDPMTLDEMKHRLTQRVGRSTSELFDISLLIGGNGHLTIVQTPVETEVERSERLERTQREILLRARLGRERQIEADKRRAAAHPDRAIVTMVEDGLAISIDGMIADLDEWRPPPDVWNEESAGFHRALHDIKRYLETRKRRF